MLGVESRASWVLGKLCLLGKLSQLHNLLLSVCCREYGVSLEALCYLVICLLRQDLTLGWPGIHHVSPGVLELMEIFHPLLSKC